MVALVTDTDMVCVLRRRVARVAGVFLTFDFKNLQWESTCRHQIFDSSAELFPCLYGCWFNAAQSSFVLCIAAESCNVHFCAALLQKDSWSLDAVWDCQSLFRDGQWFQTLLNNVRRWSSLITDVQWCLMLRIEQFSDRSDALEGLLRGGLHICVRNKAYHRSTMFFHFDRGSLMLLSAAIFWTVLLRTAQRCSLVREAFSWVCSSGRLCSSVVLRSSGLRSAVRF
mgnify:CR=1 FL=1